MNPSAPWSRRQWMAYANATLAGTALMHAPQHALALPARKLSFPRDHGSHPELRTEWWYITGHALAQQRLWGFQVTFFRSRVDATQTMRSQFAAKQLIFAHAALTDVQGRQQLHDQRMARAGFGIAEAAQNDTQVRLRNWSLQRSDAPKNTERSRYMTKIQAREFALDLELQSTQAVLLQGNEGLSRKGPESDQASYYYSQPQLAVRGSITLRGQRMEIEANPASAHANRAWMDHEWSEALMHPEAVGWDWIGMNLNSGDALTAFRLRRADGSTLWSGGSLRLAQDNTTRVFAHNEVQFSPLREWTSPHSRARYPVDWKIDTPVGAFNVYALLDDQELDSQGTTGAVYWEGLSELKNPAGQTVGRGYLEMTGYTARIRLS